MTPQQINKSLLRNAHTSGTPQGVAWDQLILDLLLANQDATAWGWADPETLPVLDSWKKADSGIFTIFVYEDFEYVVAMNFFKKSITEKSIRTLYQEWDGTNAKILHAYDRYKESSIIVNGEYALKHKAEFIETVGRFLPLESNGWKNDPSEHAVNASLYTSLAHEVIREMELDFHNFSLLRDSAALKNHTERLCWIAMWNALADHLVATDNQIEMTQCSLETDLNAALHEGQLLLSRMHAMEIATLEKELPVPRYGAAECARQHLAYRFGETMTRESRSLAGWPRMPFILLKQYRAYLRERKQRGGPLPAISSFADAKAGKAVKKTLEYRLGQAFIDVMTSPLRWPTLPFALRAAARKYRESTGPGKSSSGKSK